MSSVLRFLIFLACLGIVVWAIKERVITIPGDTDSPIIQIKSILNLSSKPSSPSATLSDDQLIEKINKFRSENKIGVLKKNSLLEKAAKSRLASILLYKDYEGTISGLTRESAVKMTGYVYEWVGDLAILDFFPGNDPIKYWEDSVTTKSTLTNKYLKDIGVAITESEGRLMIYVIVGSTAKPQSTQSQTSVKWGGIELWKAINKRRQELGVGELKQSDELCTLAAIRLNQNLSRGSLDNHEGFETTLARDDLKYLKSKYTISEFLIYGYPTPEDSVKAWENTLGHRKLLSGGEYVWGCVYSQNTFGVAIAAY